jgi:hypothetical protein
MSKHTPGPWLKAETRTEGFVITSRDELIVHSIDEYGHYGPIKTSANANLIVAAPDLLEALESMMDMIGMASSSPNPAVRKLIEKSLSAIARAKGESQ